MRLRTFFDTLAILSPLVLALGRQMIFEDIIA